jgi:hypothetical protein
MQVMKRMKDHFTVVAVLMLIVIVFLTMYRVCKSEDENEEDYEQPSTSPGHKKNKNHKGQKNHKVPMIPVHDIPALVNPPIRVPWKRLCCKC